MKKNLPELIIRYDQRNRCVVLSASHKGSLKGKDDPFSVVWSIEELQRQSDSGEMVIGAAVLAFFDQVSDGGLGLKDYKNQAELDQEKIIADLERSANSNDSSAQYSLAIFLMRRGAKEKSLRDIKVAEKWLRTAAKGGNTDASTYLKLSWPDTKKAITDRIKTK